MYVTLEDAKTHLRVDFDDDDADLQGKILAASSAVKNYMKTASVYEPNRDADGNPETDADGNFTYPATKRVRFEVRAATLILVGELYKNREAEQDGDAGLGMLPAPVIALLYPLRDPALA